MPIYRSYRLSRSFAQLKRILAAVITIGGVPPIRGIPSCPPHKVPTENCTRMDRTCIEHRGYYIGRGRRKRKRRGEGRRIGYLSSPNLATLTKNRERVQPWERNLIPFNLLSTFENWYPSPLPKNWIDNRKRWSLTDHSEILTFKCSTFNFFFWIASFFQ